MNLKITFQPSQKLALRDPESSEFGQKIVRQGIVLMAELGYENFTFKKLAEAAQTTEASIYRYFENKHRLLLYFLTWYWNYLEYIVLVSLKNLNEPALKIKKVIEILTTNLPDWADAEGIDKNALFQIVLSESSKTYLIKEVDSINREHLFKPYKDLCGRVAALFLELNPNFEYPRSLASTLLEMAQFQTYFREHLPALTDFGREKNERQVPEYLEKLVFSALKN